MIVPSVSIANLDFAKIDFRAKLFGKLVLVGSADDLEHCRSCVLQYGGRLDLIIDLKDLEVDAALGLLNDGASEIVVTPNRLEAFAEQVPLERIRVAIDGSTEIPQNVDANLAAVGILADEGVGLVELDRLSSRGNVLISGEESPSRIGEHHRSRIDCVVPLEKLTPSLICETLSAILSSDRPDALWPTVIVDELGVALGLAYSNPASLYEAAKTGMGVYWSRSRNELWEKGKTSGATQTLVGIAVDCDSDCLRFMVRQRPPGFCHRNTYSCFGEQRTIQTVLSRLLDRLEGDDEKSFTRRLATDPEMLRKKLLEEAEELAEATDVADVTWEAADLIYFAFVRMLQSGAALDDVYAELARRMNRVVRRPNKLLQTNEDEPEL